MKEKNNDKIIFKDPKNATDVLLLLMKRKLRWKDIVKELANEEITQPTINNLIQELVEKKLVKRNEISSRNVQYQLSERGLNLIMEEKQKSRDLLFEAFSTKKGEEIQLCIDYIVEWVLRHYTDEKVFPDMKRELSETLEKRIQAEVQFLKEIFDKRIEIDIKQR